MLLFAVLWAVPAAQASPNVLLVGSYNGIPGQFTSIQDAVNAAKPGDWILVGPGDYKQSSSQSVPGAQGDDQAGADVLITTPEIHLRGMNRNTVMIDGTNPGSPECSSAEADQIFGPPGEGGDYLGNNGVVVYKADGVQLQNFSTCNFLGSEHGGDSVWFDGGGATGKQAIGSWLGEYLSSTSTYWGGTEKPSDEYGLYASNTTGPGEFTHTYAGNMSDSGYYIGACPDCNAVINEGRAESNDLGYSGSNSGGHLIIENTVFNNNEEGVASQSQNNDDAPSPQEGICPNGEKNPNPPSGVQRKNICWVMVHNTVTNNNNGETPTSDSAPGLLGTGMTIAGGRNNLVAENTFSNNDAWGILLIPFPETEQPPPQIPAEDNCKGGVKAAEGVCDYDVFANEIANNSFSANGSYGNPTNADIGEVTEKAETEGNCWHGNVDPEKAGGTPSSYPVAIQETHGTCGAANAGGEPVGSPLSVQAVCDSQLLAKCPAGTNYPRSENVQLAPLPQEPSMPNPCENVPANPWCSASTATTPPVSLSSTPTSPPLLSGTPPRPSAKHARVQGCKSKRAVTIHLPHYGRSAIVKVVAFVNGKRVKTMRGRSLHAIYVSFKGRPGGAAKTSLRLSVREGGRIHTRSVVHHFHLCVAGKHRG